MLLPAEFYRARHKIVWNDFEQALLGPQGAGQGARSNLMLDALSLEIATLVLKTTVFNAFS